MQGPGPAGFCDHGKDRGLCCKDNGGAVEVEAGRGWCDEDVLPRDQVTFGQRQSLPQASSRLVESSIFCDYVHREDQFSEHSSVQSGICKFMPKSALLKRR